MDLQAALERLQRLHDAHKFPRVILLADEYLQQPELAPIHAQVLYMRGFAQRRQGPAWVGAALSSYRQGLRLARKPWLRMKFLSALARIYAGNGDWTAFTREVLPPFERLARSRDKQVKFYAVWVLFFKGATLDNCFRYAESREAYRQALARAREFPDGHPEYPSILHNLGGAELYLGNLEEALRLIQEAEPLQPDDGYRESRWAEYWLAVRDYVAALDWVMRALTHPTADDGVKANAYYVWAGVLKQQGDIAGARERAHRGLELAYAAVDYALIQQFTTFLKELEGPQ
jgi:tetratricopeptide (TPR) repeat protein